MVKTVGFDHYFNVPWEHATTAFWCKYPNPDLKHVKDALVLERYIENGVLHTKRLMCIQQNLPQMLKPFAKGIDSYYAVEDSIVDLKNKRMVLKTRNLTFGSLLDADEICIYEASDDNKTKYTWEVTCECTKRIPFVTEKVEEALVERAMGNSSAGLSKMEELTHQVSRRFTDSTKQQKYVRWNTVKHPQIQKNTQTNSENTSNKNKQEEYRRFLFFGPRKSILESSYNPFRNCK